MLAWLQSTGQAEREERRLAWITQEEKDAEARHGAEFDAYRRETDIALALLRQERDTDGEAERERQEAYLALIYEAQMNPVPWVRPPGMLTEDHQDLLARAAKDGTWLDARTRVNAEIREELTAAGRIPFDGSLAGEVAAIHDGLSLWNEIGSGWLLNYRGILVLVSDVDGEDIRVQKFNTQPKLRGALAMVEAATAWRCSGSRCPGISSTCQLSPARRRFRSFWRARSGLGCRTSRASASCHSTAAAPGRASTWRAVGTTPGERRWECSRARRLQH